MIRVILATFLFVPFVALAEHSAEDVIRAFFDPDFRMEKSQYYSGEMAEYPLDTPTLGETLPPDVNVSFRRLPSGKSIEVYAVDLSKAGNTQNWYAYLKRRDSVWKLEAVRTLALAGLLYAAKLELEKKDTLSDSESWNLRNIKLTLSKDCSLKAHALDNYGLFEEMAAVASSGSAERANELGRSLHVSDVMADESKVWALIGGVVDNSVGYVYVKKGNPPAIDPNKYIYVEHIKGGWYVYKTT